MNCIVSFTAACIVQDITEVRNVILDAWISCSFVDIIDMMNANVTDEIKPIRSYREYETIFQEGSWGNEMYLIHSGKVSLN